jgi:hypothetical protein
MGVSLGLRLIHQDAAMYLAANSAACFQIGGPPGKRIYFCSAARIGALSSTGIPNLQIEEAIALGISIITTEGIHHDQRTG